MSRQTPPNYKTMNWPAYNEALKRRGSLTIWFDSKVSWKPAPLGTRGRQQTYSDTAIQTCLTMKGEGRRKTVRRTVFSPERAKPRVVRHGAPADYRVRREPAAACWTRLDSARLQYPVPPSEDPDRQVAELQVRIAALNGYTALDISVTEAAGYPKTIRVDNGSEFISRDMDLGAYQRGVILDFSRPGKPTDNAFNEAFNSKFRAECLNVHWFLSLSKACEKMEEWRRYYNEERPHSAIRNIPPTMLANSPGDTSPPC